MAKHKPAAFWELTGEERYRAIQERSYPLKKYPYIKERNTKRMKLYTVPVTTDLQMSLTTNLEAYAVSPTAAAAKVQARIYNEALPNDLEFQDESEQSRIGLGATR